MPGPKVPAAWAGERLRPGTNDSSGAGRPRGGSISGLNVGNDMPQMTVDLEVVKRSVLGAVGAQQPAVALGV